MAYGTLQGTYGEVPNSKAGKQGLDLRDPTGTLEDPTGTIGKGTQHQIRRNKGSTYGTLQGPYGTPQVP